MSLLPKILLCGAAAFASVTARALPLAVPERPTELFGSLVFAYGWASQPDSPYGIYSFTDSDGSPFRLVKRGNDYIANGGACYAGGKYFAYGYITGEYGEIGDIFFRVFDTEDDWKKVREVQLYGTSSIPTDLTYNPKEDKVYGCFWISPSSTSFSLATVNLLTGQPTPIATLPEQLVALAARRDGLMVGIGISGIVYRVDTSGDGPALTEIGHSNLNVRYAQSATFDHATDRLLWSVTMHDFEQGSVLYEVDTEIGAVTYLNAYPDGYEMTGIYTATEAAYPAAPAAPADARFDFAADRLSGNVSFTMPVLSYDGVTNLTDGLTYEVVVDDNPALFRKAEAAAGEAVNVPYSFTEPGYRMLRVSALKDGLRGPVKTDYRWVGADKARALNPVLTQTATGVSLAWEAPTTGVHGGYIPTDRLTYRVVRQPEGTQVYEGTALTFSEAVDYTELGLYWYDVTAVADGQVGETASSNKLRLGESLPIPYTENFYNEDATAFYTFVDANKDGFTAMHYEDYLAYSYNPEQAADDWAILPPLAFNSESVYLLTAKVKAQTAIYPERFSLHFGAQPTPEAMMTELLPPTDVTWDEYKVIKAQIRPRDNRPGYVGFHFISDANEDMICVDDISVERLASALAPDTVTDLRAVAAPLGALKATVSFTLPTKALNGTSAAALTSVEIARNGKVIATLSDRKDGEKVTFEDESALIGFNTYSVTVKNAAEGAVSASVKVYVGTDRPAGVPALKLKDFGKGDLSLSWQAPEKGVNGGYIDPASLTYEVKYLGNQSVAVGIAETSFRHKTDYPVGTQKLAWFTVTPKSSTGVGQATPSDTIAVGDAYSLPFIESFVHMQTAHSSWNVLTDGVARWSITSNGTIDVQDGDGGCVMFSPMMNGTGGSFVSPKIDLTSGGNPVLTYWVWHHHESDNLFETVLRSADGTEQVLESFNSHDRLNPGAEYLWVQHSVELKNFRLEADQQLVFRCKNQSFNFEKINYLGLDNICIRDVHAADLRVLNIEGGSEVKVGEPIRFTVKVDNYGRETQEDYRIVLYRDDRKVAEAKGTLLRPDYQKNFSLTDTPNADAAQTSRYRAEVVCEGDGDPTNNMSADLVVTVQPGLPFVDDLTGKTEDDATTLSWSTPPTVAELAPAATDDGTVTDDFESYAAFSITNAGAWTFYDGDGATTGGIIGNDGYYVSYENVEKPMAFMVFNPSKAGLSSAYFPTRSGKQVMASFLSTLRNAPDDDWMISPELDGKAQTIKFWASAPDCDYYGSWEDVEILYSTTDQRPASFTKVKDVKVNSTAWREVSVALPEGAKYFAIRKVSEYQYVLFIDDVTYRPAKHEQTLTGYHVYRGDECLTPAPVKALTYTDHAAGHQVYTVTAVYDVDGKTVESIRSNVYDTDLALGIDRVSVTNGDALRVESLVGGLRLTFSEGDARIFTADGRLVRRVSASGTVTLPAGVYLVEVNGHSIKAVVR